MMKNPNPLAGGLALLLTLLVDVPVGAQVPTPSQDGDPGSPGSEPSPVDTGKLTQAVALFEQGHFKEAKDLLAPIREHKPEDARDPVYIAAHCYEALCLHGLKDYHAFMKLLEWVDIRAVDVPAKIRENLASAQIDGLFYFRKFDDIFPAIDAFKTEYPASARLDMVAEYHLAALFERGLKKTLEAVRLKDDKFEQRWAEGKTNLDQFLSLAASHPAGDYAVLPKRSLREDLWTARVILGDRAAILEEIPAGDAAGRERFDLLCALLYPKIEPDQADKNLKMMADFLEAYPESRDWARVELEMAGVSLHEGERLVQQTGPAAAATYFDFARERFSRVVGDEDAVIEETGMADADIWDAREGMIRACFWQKDYANLSEWTKYLISITEPGDKRWRQAKLFDALALASQDRYGEVGSIVDEVVALGFTGQPGQDGITIAAVRLRIFVALQADDHSGVRQLVQMVRDSGCADIIKRRFVKEYAWVE